MGYSKKVITICQLFILISVFISIGSLSVFACVGIPEPVDYEPETDNGSVPAIDPNNVVVDPNTSANGSEGQEPETPLDPVLLNTGEFLFTRHDGAVGAGHTSFPLIRTYRGKPIPVVKNNNVEPLESGGSECWTDWYILTWKEAPYDPYYPIDISFTITPIEGSGGYEETSVESAWYDSGYRTFQSLATGWDGTAFRFKLGTGNTYQVEFIIKRQYPVSWSWSGGQWVPYYGFNPWQILYESSGIVNIPAWASAPMIVPSNEHSPLSRGDNIEAFDPEDFGKRPGWEMSYNIFVAAYPDPNENNQIDERTIFLNAGNGDRFKYTPDPNLHSVYGEIYRSSSTNDFLKAWSYGGFTLYKKQNERWNFNTKGNCTHIIRKNKLVALFYYDSGYGLDGELERLDYIQDYYRRKTRLIYTNSSDVYPGNLSQIIDYTGRTWEYDYYVDGNLKSVTDPEGYKETYEYSADGALEIIKDHNGDIWLDNDYDEEGRVYQQAIGGDPNNGYTSTITYNETNSVVTDAQGIDTTYVLNDAGYSLSKTQETDDGSVTTLYEYNSMNQLTKITYPEENSYELAYDPNGALVSFDAFSSDPSDPNLAWTLTYTEDDWVFLKTVTDPRNNTTTYTYDYEDPNNSTDDGLLMKIAYPQVTTDLGLETPEVEFTYTSNNQLETVTSPDGIVLKYEYWADMAEPNSLGKAKKVTIDYGSDPACKNIEYTFDYDGTGRVVDVTTPDNHTTTLTYNVLDLVEQIENPAGDITKLTYNADRKLEKTEKEFEGGWQTFEYGYNIMAKLTTITDSLGRTTTLGYDSRYQVDSIEDANTNETTKDYNARKLVKEIIDAELGSTKFEYDDNGRLSVITDDEDADTEYQYDGYGRLETVTYADNSDEQYGYDANGNLTSFRNRANEMITFTYDALNRLTSKTRPGESAIELTYDIAGRLVDVSQGTTDTMTFDYDRLGRLELTVDQNSNPVGYEYDTMNRRTELTYPDSMSITYEYDNVGRLEYIKDENGDPIVWYQYDELGRTAQVNYYRGLTSVGSMSYDFEDKVAGNDDNLGNRIAQIDYCCYQPHSISYTYDNVGNVTSMDVGNNYDWSYLYDKTYQVIDVDQGSATNRMAVFQYDSVYNRTFWYDNKYGTYNTYQDNAMNQYSRINITSLTYDARGNCTSYGGNTMAYDCENRLTSAEFVSYTYDLLGRRQSRTRGLNETQYVWDGAHIIAEYDRLGSLTKKYIYGPGMDNPVAMINVSGTSETWYYYYADAQGSIRLMTDASGTPVESYTYDTFGKPHVMTSAGADGNWLTEDVTTSQSSSIGNPYLFTGRRWDNDTELYYYRFRDYHPELGRFLQADPAGYIDTMNVYAYCGNNPINWIDPWGLVPYGPFGPGTFPIDPGGNYGGKQTPIPGGSVEGGYGGYSNGPGTTPYTSSGIPGGSISLEPGAAAKTGWGIKVFTTLNPGDELVEYELGVIADSLIALDDAIHEKAQDDAIKQLQEAMAQSQNANPYDLESIADFVSDEWVGKCPLD